MPAKNDIQRYSATRPLLTPVKIDVQVFLQEFLHPNPARASDSNAHVSQQLGARILLHHDRCSFRPGSTL